MATQYLSKTGLTYLWGRIVALYQPKEAGKGLSTNDLTDELKAQIEKVSGIETQVENLVNEGGEPNVIETVKVNGTALTPDADKAVDACVPKVQARPDMNGGPGIGILDYDGTSSNAPAVIMGMNAAKTQLKVQIGGGSNTETGVIELPDETRVNALIAAAVTEGVGDITSFEYQNVATLPATGEKGVIYLVPNSGSNPNVKDEYIWINKGTAESPDYAFELLGTTELDLSGYLQSTDIEAITTAEIDAITGA